MMCPMAEQRLGSPGGVKLCVCCILFSIQVVATIAQTQPRDTGAHQRTRQEELNPDPKFDNVFQNFLATTSKVQGGTMSGKGRISQLHSKESPLVQTIAGGTSTAGIITTATGVRLSPERTSSGNSGGKAQPHTESRDAILPSPRSESRAMITSTTIKALLMSTEHHSSPTLDGNKTNALIQTQPINHTTDVSQDAIVVDVQTDDENTLLESTTVNDGADRKHNKNQVSPTTVNMAIQHDVKIDNKSNATSRENRANTNGNTILKSLPGSNDTKPWLPNNNQFVTRNNSKRTLPLSRTTPKSGVHTKPAIGSPLSAVLHRSTSVPNVRPRQTVVFPNFKTKKSLLTPRTGARFLSFKAPTFTSINGLKDFNKETSMMSENSASSVARDPEVLLFRTSSQTAVIEHDVVKDNSLGTFNDYTSTEITPKMAHQSGVQHQDNVLYKSTYSDNQSALKTTLANELRHKVTKHKSTARVRRSTRDTHEDDSTIPSSKRESNAAILPESLTLQPSPYSSKPSSLRTSKRHVPHQDPGLYSGLDCQDSQDKIENNSIMWLDGDSLTVSLSGKAEALTVTWEIISGSSKIAHGNTRQGLEKKTADHSNRIARQADVTKPISSDKRAHANMNPNITKVDGFVVSYRIPKEEEYDSSRLRASVRYFVLHSLHPDKAYIICVHAMAGTGRVYEKCAEWKTSERRLKAVMGGMAGAIFFMPCVIVIILFLRKDRQMRAKNEGGWQLTHPSLARGFSTCEESHEALVQEARNSDGGINASSFFRQHSNATVDTSTVHEFQHNQQLKYEQETKKEQTHRHGAHSTGLANNSLRTSVPQDSTRNIPETDILADRELPLLHNNVDDNVFRSLTIANITPGSIAAESPPLPLLAHISVESDPNRETNI
ncbi:hypothetical protein ElyMa_000547200 [Elysia marginata]|uniref:Fibronectin type-III domain-containing protein n=1 Tax=Elysia marginata TaxID=1093978 RepID=A0AAV4G1B0_9GAST|nr:hypothetical protein ElyMa_000547200 [Elysia marginata]